MNVLVVDDVAGNRDLLRAVLETGDHTVVEAADGVEALHALREHDVDAVITDILMPNMDGFRLCQELRVDTRWATLPVIVYTSTYTAPGDKQLAYHIGADLYLTKPTPAETLLCALRECAERARSWPVGLGAPISETIVVKEYNEALVRKLEHKNAELQATVRALEQAQSKVQALNSELEQRVRERTSEWAAANNALKEALANVKQLSGLLPICSHCRKVRDDRNYWQTVEQYVCSHTDARFSHGVCPTCYETIVAPELKRLGVDVPERYGDAERGASPLS